MQEFAIPSMSCGGCASQVARAIKGQDAQAKIEVDLSTRTVRVDSLEDRACLSAALVDAGYPPK